MIPFFLNLKDPTFRHIHLLIFKGCCLQHSLLGDGMADFNLGRMITGNKDIGMCERLTWAALLKRGEVHVRLRPILMGKPLSST